MTKKPLNLGSFFKVTFVISFAGLSFFLAPHIININVQVNAATPGRLLGYEQTYNSDRSANTTLVSIDQSTGVSTPLGQTLESSITGTSQFDLGRFAFDAEGHRIFFIAANINGDFNQ